MRSTLVPARCRVRRDGRPGRRLAARTSSRALLGELGDAQLVYSDARVVARDGELISETWWNRRRNNHDDLLSLLVANSVTGAASLFRRELLDYALPFPPAPVPPLPRPLDRPRRARASARSRFVPEPLYDYVQHGARVARARAREPDDLARANGSPHQRRLRERVQLWRLHYFVDIWRLRQFCAVLLMRAGPAMRPPRSAATLERFLDGRPFAALAARRSARAAPASWSGRPRRSAPSGVCSTRSRGDGCSALTARERPQRAASPRRAAAAVADHGAGLGGARRGRREIARKIAPLRWSVVEDAPARVNLLIPTIDLAALLRRLHRQVQPRTPAGRAWRCGCGS